MPKTSCNTEHLNPGHLSPDQIDDHLIGDLAPEPAAHLASCAVCTELVASVSAPIANFQAVTHAWSDRRSATMPVYVPAASLQPQHMALRIAAGATAAVILMMGVTTMPLSRHQATQQTAVTASQPAAQPQALAEIASTGPTEMIPPQEQAPRDGVSARILRDNQMLQDIDTALATPSESAASLGLEPVSTEQGQQPVAMSLQD
jgi:hypothetical protein